MAIDLQYWIWENVPLEIGKKVVVGTDLYAKEVIVKMSLVIQSLVIEEYLPHWKIKSASVKLFQLNADLKTALTPNEMFVVWRLLDDFIGYLEQMAIEEECFEGIVNLKKLKDIV